jgi:hypothetical protein
MRQRQEQHQAAQQAPAENPNKVSKTGQLYRIPRLAAPGASARDLNWAAECVTWPRYLHGEFSLQHTTGVGMLELTEEETRALQIVVLRTEVKPQRFGAAHQVNWKKVGLSRAYFQKNLVHEGSMPTPRAAAAFRFLMAHNRYYATFSEMQGGLLQAKQSLNLTSYALFILHPGIECAMFPVLYPTTDFTDTGINNRIMQHYKAGSGDDTHRVISIGQSWTRKVLSSVRVYGEQRDLPFFLYEKTLAQKFFNAHVRAKQHGVTGDVMVRDSQASSGYWDIVQDALADLVRIMLVRCYDEEKYPKLFQHVRDLRGQVWLSAFPNLFITIARHS